MSEENKNSFRETMLIIFVVVICFGITIVGIIYLTGKIFSSGGELEPIAEVTPKEVITDPEHGDTIVFTPMDEAGSEVSGENNIQATITPGSIAPQVPQKPMSNVTIVDNTQDSATTANTNVVVNTPPTQPETQKQPVEEKKPAAQNTAEKKDPARQKQIEEKPKTTAPAQKPVKQEEKKAEPKKETAKKEPVKQKEQPKQTAQKPAPQAQSAKKGDFVVQIAAVQSKEAADREVAKYRKKYPDTFIQQAVINGKTWYRIRMGVSSTREEAQKKADKVAADFKITPKVTLNK